MAADFSRVRSNPLLDFAGVELKQGGVLLDADANELVAIIDRRVRALASDTLGRATVSSTTPNAFKITAAPGNLQIDKGRMYVDGLLAENHGAQSTEPAKCLFDSLMAERMFVDAVPYASQIYLPSPPALPTTGHHLVYLEVWNREVTNLEKPILVESAVAVETSSRIQTVWQVRVLLDDVGTTTSCGTPDASIPGWATLIAPSTGVLTTGIADVPQTDDPCDLPPTGGYRGPENQLYRVEIQDPGQPGDGKATFKWSRENASVGSRVARMLSSTELELDSLGRDDVLRFNRDDWVEIVDDTREFSQRCGEMRKIDVNKGGHITFTPALPAEMLPGAFPNVDFPRDHNLRVRRWDQARKVLKISAGGTTSVFQDLDAGTSGVIDVPATGTTLILENGVTVSFDSTGAKGFKAGDHWEFAARTSDASIEPLVRAPARGIHHHYARLGIWDVAAVAVTDCRHPWPPATGGGHCMCTACVTSESHASGQLTIQNAVDKVRDTGGTVCLHEGQYVLREAVRIAAAKSLRIHGQGSATMIVAPGAAFIIERSVSVAVEDISVVSLGRNESAISVRTVFGLALRRLVVAVLGDNDAQGAAIALSGVVMAATIDNNLLLAPDGVRALEPTEEAPNMLMTAGLRIDDNVFLCRDSAVKLAGRVAHAYETRLTGNQVVGTREVGISAAGMALPGASIRMSDNNLNVYGPGIRCAVDGAWIEGNKIYATPGGHRVLAGSGIELTTGLDKSGSDQAQVLANQISGFPDAGISINAPVRDLIVNLNIIEKCGNGIVMTDAASAGSLTIENNHLRDIGLRTPNAMGATATTVGIGITRTETATVVGNTLRKIGLEATENKLLIAGIAAFSVQHPRISGNKVSELGPVADFGGTVAGITIRAPYSQTEVMHNHVERDVQANNTKSDTAWFALQIDEPTPGGNFLSRIAGYAALRVDASRTLVLFGNRAYVNNVISAAGVDPATGAAAEVQGSSASILGNVFSARGRVPAVDVTASGEVLFNDNQCELRANFSTTAVLLNTRVAVINANRVRGAEDSIRVPDPKALVAAIGNITTRPINASLKPEMLPLNLIG